jgi:hypothetical protein
MRELLRRDVVRTANNPIGDIAEAIVAEHYDGGGVRQGFSNSGWDGTTPGGQRLEVKAIRLTGVPTRANLSPIPAASSYTDLIIVVFDADLRVTEALTGVAHDRRDATAGCQSDAVAFAERLLNLLDQGR